MIKVVILAHSHITLFEMSCAAELFALPRPEFEPWYDCEIINMAVSYTHLTLPTMRLV